MDGPSAHFLRSLRARYSSQSASYVSLSRLIFGSHSSFDFMISSHVTSCSLYAAVRAIMQESADSLPLAAWLWKLPLVMLSMKAFFFSGSANSRLEVNFPVTEKA